MGTKEKPGRFDCIEKALTDEPVFVLLARDETAPLFVTEWATTRAAQVMAGERPMDDLPQIVEALECAQAMITWRKANEGKWQTPESIAALENMVTIVNDRLPQVRLGGTTYWLVGPNSKGPDKAYFYAIAPLDHFDDNGECLVDTRDAPCFAVYDPTRGVMKKDAGGVPVKIGEWEDLEIV
jgi:hypothetical protein